MRHPNPVRGLFDVDFAMFVTVSIVKAVYLLVVAGLVAVLVVAETAIGFEVNRLGYVPTELGLAAAGAPVVTALGVLMTRLACELLVVVFRIAEELQTIRVSLTHRH